MQSTKSNIDENNINNQIKQNHMLRWTISFIVIALVAGVLGFGGIAGAAAGIAKICFYIFIVLFLVSLVFKGKAKI